MKKSLIITTFFLILFIACTDNSNKETDTSIPIKQNEKRTDKIEKDSIKNDSIKTDTLSQRHDHGHNHDHEHQH